MSQPTRNLTLNLRPTLIINLFLTLTLSFKPFPNLYDISRALTEHMNIFYNGENLKKNLKMVNHQH